MLSEAKAKAVPTVRVFRVGTCRRPDNAAHGCPACLQVNSLHQVIAAGLNERRRRKRGLFMATRGRLAASMRDGSAFCMRDDVAAIERSVRLDRCN